MPKCHRSVKTITPELYNHIKAELKSPADDELIMHKYHISQTTARWIRNTDSYLEYRSKVVKKHQNLDEVIDKARYDYPESALDNDIVFEAEPLPSTLTRIASAFLLLCLCLVALALTLGIFKWTLGF